VRAASLPTTGLDLAPWPTHILDYLRTFFTANNVDLPEIQRIVPGQLSLDSWMCEQLAVGCAGIGDFTAQQGTTAGAARAGTPYSAMTMRQVVYGVQLVRCIDCNADAGPDLDTTNAAGLQQLTDMGLLSQAIVNLGSAPPPWHPSEVNIRAGDVTPLGPSGGYWALEANVTMTVDALKQMEPPPWPG
jgi:hypothetical protein